MIEINEKGRDYKKEYDEYHGNPEQIKNRQKRNEARKKKGLEKGDSREVDHKVPLSKGGSNSDKNTRVVSRDTNRKKGSNSLSEKFEEVDTEKVVAFLKQQKYTNAIIRPNISALPIYKEYNVGKLWIPTVEYTLGKGYYRGFTLQHKIELHEAYFFSVVIFSCSSLDLLQDEEYFKEYENQLNMAGKRLAVLGLKNSKFYTSRDIFTYINGESMTSPEAQYDNGMIKKYIYDVALKLPSLAKELDSRLKPKRKGRM